MAQVALLVASYLLGAIPFGVYVARSYGVDLFSIGSKSTGATNVGRSCGPRAGILVFVLDVLKGLLPAVAGWVAFNSREFGFSCGMVAMLGHSLSPFLGFRGGKGISTGLGAVLGSAPMLAASCLGVFAVPFLLTGIVSLSSLSAALSLVTLGWLYHEPKTLEISYIVLAMFIFVRHWPNILRLISGTEPKFRFGSHDGKANEPKGTQEGEEIEDAEPKPGESKSCSPNA